MNQVPSLGTHGYELEMYASIINLLFSHERKEGQSARADSCSSNHLFFSSKSPLLADSTSLLFCLTCRKEDVRQ